MLEVKSVSKSFGDVPAIRDVSFKLQKNEYVTVLGPSGSGKTTLLRIIAGLLNPDKGKVFLEGENINNLPCHERKIGFVQQKYALFPHLSVFDNIAFGLRHRNDNPISVEKAVRTKVNDIIDLVRLAGQEDKMTGQISGGQKQRVSLARTLVTGPEVCLLDEPLGALDANLRERMTIELQGIRRELGISFLHVTGNEFESLAMGQRMLVMANGMIVEQGEPQAMYSTPNDLVTAEHMHHFNIFSGDHLADHLKAGIKGQLSDDRISGVSHCAVRMDRIEITTRSTPQDEGLPAEFLTSEFLGNKIIYFFKTEDGQICEVEDHLSLKEPMHLEAGSTHLLSWDIRDALFYDTNKQLMN